MTQLHTLGLLNREGMKACNEGRTDDAMFKLVQADRLAQAMDSPLHEAKIRNNIGLVHQMAGKDEEALACYRLAAKNAVKGAGEGNSLHSVILRNLNRLESMLQERAA